MYHVCYSIKCQWEIVNQGVKTRDSLLDLYAHTACVWYICMCGSDLNVAV